MYLKLRTFGLVATVLGLLAVPLATEAQREAADPVARRFELLKQLVPDLPDLGRVAILACCLESLEPRTVEERNTVSIIRETLTAARSAGVRTQLRIITAQDNLDDAWSSLLGLFPWPPSALLVLPSPKFMAQRSKLAELALRHKLPSVFDDRRYVEAGGLIAYGASHAVEQPTRFELVINVKTAAALGLTIPPSVLQGADQVIE